MIKITGVHIFERIEPYTLLEVSTDADITGIGITRSPSTVIGPIIKAGRAGLEQALVGEDPHDVRQLWRKMFIGWGAQRGRGAEGGLAVNAMAALDMALWDIRGKALGLPIYRLLGGAVQPQVMAYASASAFDYRSIEQGARDRKSLQALVKESQTYVQQGFKAIKYGWGNDFGPEGKDKLAAIREAIGPETRLMLDFGCPAYWTGGWNAKAAIRAAQLLEAHDVYFLEEPMPPYDVEGYANVTQASHINIAAGESLSTIYEFEHFIRRRALDIVQPDAAQMGITQIYDVAHSAQQAGMLCIPHSPWSALVVAAHVHVLATTPAGAMVEYPAFASSEGARLNEMLRIIHYEIVEHPLQLQDGFVQLPTKPGLGLGGYRREAIAELEAALSQGGRA
jgi:L-alanine-DL-glutamate epimerase-like enolase superfamily enzyme